MMNNIVILPLAIPLIAGLVMVIFRKNIPFQRIVSIVSMLGVMIVSGLLVRQISNEGIQVLQLGGWEAPFGISFVADMFSTLLVLTGTIVTLFCLIYAFYTIGKEREKFYVYPFIQFLIAGVNGSFLTGDIFNLFVCFEVMLIASYVLIVHGGTKLQLRESIIYVLINVLSSALFLVAVANLYSTTGTLNLAHLSVRIAEVGQGGILTTIALLFLVVFGLKAGLFLYFWLPGSYSAPPTAIAAIFAALLTKVGIYSIFRMFTLVFYHETEVTHSIIAFMAIATMILGSLGAVASNHINKILAYNVVIAVGLIVSGLAVFTSEAILGAIYYLLQDIIVKALIFLLGGAVVFLIGTNRMNKVSGLIRNYPFLGWMFFVASMALVGIPPLSGFIGKLFITKGALGAEFYALAAVGLLSSLFILISLMKIFMNVFWGETNVDLEYKKGSTVGFVTPIACLTVIMVAFGLGIEVFQVYIEQATYELLNPKVYIEAVLAGR